MNEQEKLYHSALSRCAELLDNMGEGDPLIDVPMFLDAKLKQMRTPVPRMGGITIEELDLPALPLDLDSTPSRVFIQIKAGELAAHMRRWGNAVYLAGQSQATRAQAKSGTVQNLLHCALKELLGALPERRDWFNPDAEKVLRAVAEAGPVPAQEVTKQAVSDLHNAIMNLPANRATIACSGWTEDEIKVYKIGHRDARHAAAELVNEAEAAQEVTQQAAPTAWLATDLDGRGDVAFTKEDAKRRAGEGCTEFFPLYDPADLAPVTQQAAKAETAEQAEGDQANVLPPTRGTDGQLDAALATLAPFAELAELFDPENRGSNMPGEDADPVMQWPRLHKHYELTVGHLRAARSVLASRCRAQGGNTNSNSPEFDGISGSDLAPTASTVSAPEEVRNQTLEEAIKACQAERVEDVGPSDAAYNLATDHCISAIRALRTTSGKGDAV